MIQGLDGKFVVSGSNAYFKHGTYTVTVTIMDGATIVATTSTTATVADYAEGPLTLGVSFSDDGYGRASDYTATVQWGDTTSDQGGIIMAAGGNTFNLTDTHRFAPGVYTVTVTIQDDGGSSITSNPAQTVNATVWVGEQPLTVYTAPIYATTGVPIQNQTIALITDPDPTGSASGASIDWGDGSASNGNVSGGGGLFAVVGTHDYNGTGSYAVAFNFSSAGGLVLPGVLQAVLAQNKAVKGKGASDRVKAAGGDFGWAITAKDGQWLGKTAKATLSFIPAGGCKCENIAFVQVVTRWTLGTPGSPGFTAVWPSLGGKEFFEDYSTKRIIGNFLDFLPGYTSPYPNAAWNGRSWISRPYVTGDLGNGLKMKDATFTDPPSTGEARSGKGYAIQRFETAAFCIDSQEVLGVLKWGIQTPDNKKDPMIVLNATKDDFTPSGSTDFKDLVALANKVGVSNNDQQRPLVMNHAQPNGDPKISKPLKNLLGGTSALPGN